MSGHHQDTTRTRDLYEAMVREDDDEKRHELLRLYVEAVRADNAKTFAERGG